MAPVRFGLRILLPAALLYAGLAAAQTQLATAPTPPAAAPTIPRTLDIPNGALIAPGAAPELDLLYTGDVIGFLEPCG